MIYLNGVVPNRVESIRSNNESDCHSLFFLTYVVMIDDLNLISHRLWFSSRSRPLCVCVCMFNNIVNKSILTCSIMSTIVASIWTLSSFVFRGLFKSTLFRLALLSQLLLLIPLVSKNMILKILSRLKTWTSQLKRLPFLFWLNLGINRILLLIAYKSSG